MQVRGPFSIEDGWFSGLVVGWFVGDLIVCVGSVWLVHVVLISIDSPLSVQG